MSVAWGPGNYYGVKTQQAGTLFTLQSHRGANMPHPRAKLRDHHVPPYPTKPSLPPLVNSIHVPSSVQVLSAAVQLYTRLSYATKSVSADLHETRRHLSLKDMEPGKMDILYFPKNLIGINSTFCGLHVLVKETCFHSSSRTKNK